MTSVSHAGLTCFRLVCDFDQEETFHAAMQIFRNFHWLSLYISKHEMALAVEIAILARFWVVLWSKYKSIPGKRTCIFCENNAVQRCMTFVNRSIISVENLAHDLSLQPYFVTQTMGSLKKNAPRCPSVGTECHKFRFTQSTRYVHSKHKYYSEYIWHPRVKTELVKIQQMNIAFSCDFVHTLIILM